MASAVKGGAASASPPSSAFGFLKGSSAKKPLVSPKPPVGFEESDEEDGDDDSVNELLNLRDSILIPSNKGDKDNRLADWSFIDAELLMGSMRKKKSAKWTPSAIDMLEEDARLEDASILQESNMVAATTLPTTTITTTVTKEGDSDTLEKTDATITTEQDAPKNISSSEPLNSPDDNSESTGIKDDTLPAATVPVPASSSSSEH